MYGLYVRQVKETQTLKDYLNVGVVFILVMIFSPLERIIQVNFSDGN